MKAVKRQSGCPLSAALVALLLCAITTAGCDKVESLVGEVSTSSSPAPQPVAAPSESVSPSAAPAAAPSISITPTPAPVAPQDLAAELIGSDSARITDALLTRVAAVPEAAALVTELTLTGSDVSGAGLRHLGSFTGLQSLSMQGMLRVTPAELAHLSQGTSLHSLNLTSTLTDDTVLAGVSQIPHLTSLNLTGAPVTALGVTRLAALTELQELSLENTPVNDQAVAAFLTMPLRKLNISGTQITSITVAKLAESRTLEELDIQRNRPVIGAAFKPYKANGLKVLNASETNFGTEGLVALRGHKTLEVLHLYAAGVVEHQQANVFRTMPSLRVLNLGKNAVSNAGLKVLIKGLKPLEELYLGNLTEVSDAGLAELVTCKNLKILDLTGTRCTEQGARALKEMLPECEIRLNGIRL